MEAHVRRSKVFLAFIADNYFDSEPCRWEVEEAARVGEPILPVFSGEHHLFAKLLGKFLSMKDDPVKGAAVRACFCQGENLMEVHNPLNVKKVTEDVKAKIVDRFILRPRLVKRHLRGTKAIVLVLSKEGSVFKSDLCRATLEEAIEQGIPIIPIYDSDITSPQHIKDLIEGDVDGLAKGSEGYTRLVKHALKGEIFKLSGRKQTSDAAEQVHLERLALRVRALPPAAQRKQARQMAARPGGSQQGGALALALASARGCLPSAAALPSFRAICSSSRPTPRAGKTRELAEPCAGSQARLRQEEPSVACDGSGSGLPAPFAGTQQSFLADDHAECTSSQPAQAAVDAEQAAEAAVDPEQAAEAAVDPEQVHKEERLIRLPPLLQTADRSRTSFHEEHHETAAQTTARERPPTARRCMSVGASAGAPLHSGGAGAGGEQPPEQAQDQASAPSTAAPSTAAQPSAAPSSAAPSSARSDTSPNKVVPDSHKASPRQHLVGRGGAGVGDEADGLEEVAMPQEMGVAAEEIAAEIDVDANSSSIQGVNAEAQLVLGQTDGQSRQILRVTATPRRTKARSRRALKKAQDLGKLDVVHL